MKKMMLFAALMTITAAHAQTTIFGSPQGCERWAKESKGTAPISLHNWLFGFLSGLAMMDELRDENILAHTDRDSILLWADNYCRENPLNSMEEAGVDFYLEITNKVLFKQD